MAVNENNIVTAFEYWRAHQYFFEGKPDDCWPWLGCFETGGRPLIQINKIHYRVPRITLLYSLNLKSSPLSVLHKPIICTNKPNCVNPAHLYLGTPKQNAQDSIIDGTLDGFNRKGSKHPRTNLTNEIVLKIRFEKEAFNFTYKELMKKYNLSYSCIQQIILRVTFRDI